MEIAFFLILGGLVIAFFALVRSRRSGESSVLQLVKRRRDLLTTLRTLVPDDFHAARIVNEEALRLRRPRSSLEALEAAIERTIREAQASDAK